MKSVDLTMNQQVYSLGLRFRCFVAVLRVLMHFSLNHSVLKTLKINQCSPDCRGKGFSSTVALGLLPQKLHFLSKDLLPCVATRQEMMLSRVMDLEQHREEMA